MHTLGALLLVAASASFGILQALELKKRSKELHALIRSLSLLKHDLSARAMSLPDAAAHAGRQGAPICRPFFQQLADKLSTTPLSFEALWRSELLRFSGQSAIVLDALGDLGAHLGRYDAQAQAEAIQACVDTLLAEADRADERTRQLGKLYAGLGLTVGSMLAVALY